MCVWVLKNFKDLREFVMCSKHYLKEKWESAKWDVEKSLAIYDGGDDMVPADACKRVLYNLETMFDSILKEVRQGAESK
jgi:hypothetical protein